MLRPLWVATTMALMLLQPIAANADTDIGTWCWRPGGGFRLSLTITEFPGGGATLRTIVYGPRGDTATDNIPLRITSSGYVNTKNNDRYAVTPSGSLWMFNGDQLLDTVRPGHCR